MKCHKDKWQFLPLQETHPGNGTGWGMPFWEQPCGKGLGGQGAEQEAAIYPGSKGSHQHPGLYDQEVKGKEFSGILPPAFRSLVQE